MGTQGDRSSEPAARSQSGGEGPPFTESHDQAGVTAWVGGGRPGRGPSRASASTRTPGPACC